MKFRPLLLSFSSLLFSGVLQAQITWDSNTSTTGAQDGAGTWNTSNTNWWDGASNVSFTSGDNVTFGAASGAAGAITVDNAGITAGSLTFNAPGSSSYAFSGGSITGGHLVKNGSNGVRFDNANSFTSVTVNAGANSQSDGAFRLGNANALGTAPITFANTADMTGLYFLTGAGNAVSFTNDIAFTTSTGRQTRLLLASNTTNGPQTVTFSGLLTGGVSTSKIRTDGTVASGQSVVRLTNENNTVTVSEWEIWRGALEITSDGALGNANNALRLNVAAASDPVGTGLRFGADNITLAATRNVIIADRTNIHTFDFTGSQINGAVTFSNTLVKKGSTTLTLNGSASGTGGIRIDEGSVRIGSGSTTGAVGSGGIALQTESTGLIVDRSNAISLANNITGAGRLTKNSAGTATLSGTNTFSGGITINGGRIAAAAATNLGSGAISFGNVGTGLEITGTAVTLANDISLPSSGSGNITFLTANNSSTVLNGNLSGGGSGTVLFFQGGAQSQNSGALTLNGNNSDLTGTINVQRGPLILGNANAAGNTAVILDSNNPPAGALQIGDFSISNNIQLTGGASIGVAPGNNAGISGVISGSAAFTKLGGGTLTLTNANTYSNLTNINAGTLALAGAASLASSSIRIGANASFDVSGLATPYTVAAGRSLVGEGNVIGNLEIAGSHSPGFSPGLQTFTGDLTYTSTATLTIELVGNELTSRGTDFDAININGGTLSIDPSASFNLIASAIDYATSAWDIDRSFTILDVIGGSFAGGMFALDTTAAGTFESRGSWSLAETDGDVILRWTAIPEPSSALLGALGSLLLLRRRRNR
jgi:fibronectin-binding autotransporter adhesin